MLNPPSHVGVLDDPITIAAYNDDETIRKQSSSGGVFSALARQIINRGGKVYGAGFDNDFALRHMGVDNLQDLQKLRGSKYLQSRVGTIYQDIRAELRTNKRILFTGTPCQVAGLHAFLGRIPDNLLTCDLVCHGVPSPKVFAHYLRYLRKRYRADIGSISFRDKCTGWNSYSVTVAFSNGKIYSRPLMRDVFMQGFLRNIYLRPSCYKCPFVGFPRWGDITLADYWGVEGQHPEFSDDKGTSLLFINMSKGRCFFNELKDQLTFAYSTMEFAVAHNFSATASASRPPERDAFFNNFERFPFEFIAFRYGLLGIPKATIRMYATVKQFLGSILSGDKKGLNR